MIDNSTDLRARVDGKDANGSVYTNDTSTAIRMISPLIKLEVKAPELVRRGDIVRFQIRVENSGDGNLTNLIVSDSFGEIGRIDVINPGAFQVLQTERAVTQSLQDEVKIIARDDSGQALCQPERSLRVRNSSLEIRGDPAEGQDLSGKSRLE